MRELTIKDKYELVIICMGKTWTQFCNEAGLNSGRVDKQLMDGTITQKTLDKLEEAIGVKVETGFEYIHNDLPVNIKMNVALKLSGKSKQWLAEKMGISPQSLTQRVKTSKFTLDEWKMMGEALGFEADYVFKDGDLQF